MPIHIWPAARRVPRQSEAPHPGHGGEVAVLGGETENFAMSGRSVEPSYQYKPQGDLPVMAISPCGCRRSTRKGFKVPLL